MLPVTILVWKEMNHDKNRIKISRQTKKWHLNILLLIMSQATSINQVHLQCLCRKLIKKKAAEFTQTKKAWPKCLQGSLQTRLMEIVNRGLNNQSFINMQDIWNKANSKDWTIGTIQIHLLLTVTKFMVKLQTIFNKCKSQTVKEMQKKSTQHQITT